MLVPDWSITRPSPHTHAPPSLTRKLSPQLKGSARGARPLPVCVWAARGPRRAIETPRPCLQVRLPRSRGSEGRSWVFRKLLVRPVPVAFPRAGDRMEARGKLPSPSGFSAAAAVALPRGVLEKLLAVALVFAVVLYLRKKIPYIQDSHFGDAFSYITAPKDPLGVGLHFLYW